MSVENSNLVLPTYDVAALADGFGDAGTIGSLRRGQFNKWVMTLGSIIDAIGFQRLHKTLEIIAKVEFVSRNEFAVVVTSPQVSAWAHSCLESAVEGSNQEALEAHIQHLGNIAASTAIKVGVDCEIDVPVVGDKVFLPLLGEWSCPPGSSSDRATIQHVDGTTTITVGSVTTEIPLPEGHHPQWRPLARVKVAHKGMELDLLLDDSDPYRDRWAPIGSRPIRLDADDVEAWRERLEGAWTQIVEYFPRYAESIAAGLHFIVPISGNGYNLTYVWPHAFGAISMSFPTTDEWGSMMVLDAFQRAKIQTLNNLIPLHHAVHDEYRYFTPWHIEPHPLRELLDGFYIHPVIASFWDLQRKRLEDPVERCDAEIQFVRWRDRGLRIQDVLVDSGEMTEIGLQILRGIGNGIRKLQIDSHVDSRVRHIASVVETDYRLSWRLRNLRPLPEAVSRLTNAFIASGPCPLGVGVTLEIRTGPILTGLQNRRRLLTLGLALPEVLAELVSDEDLLHEQFPTATRGDVCYLTGDLEGAVEAWSGVIEADPHDNEAWAGLGLCCSKRTDSIGRVFSSYPELVRALHEELVSAHSHFEDPLVLAAWLSPLCITLGELEFQSRELTYDHTR